jgi:hypothetical protein
MGLKVVDGYLVCCHTFEDAVKQKPFSVRHEHNKYKVIANEQMRALYDTFARLGGCQLATDSTVTINGQKCNIHLSKENEKMPSFSLFDWNERIFTQHVNNIVNKATR